LPKLPLSIDDLKPLDRKTTTVLIASIFSLIAVNFLNNASYLPFVKKFIEGDQYIFYHYLYWAISSIVFYLLLPVAVIVFHFKEKMSDYGWKTHNFFGYYQVYLIALLIILPLVFLASFDESFRETYPFYVPPKEEMIPKYFIWEFFYVLQFFALEFFFRGFMVHGLKKELGVLSVFVMTVPYGMIHFGKPLPECIGSIFAGIFLGLMSYKTNSVWMGSLTHTAVALTMNWLGLWHRGYF
jgi:hypothetical protein